MERDNGSEQVFPSGLGLPDRPELPYFAYGLFQPHELAHRQLEPLGPHSRPASVKGFLRTRDGVPILFVGGDGSVRGWLVEFPPIEGYSIVSALEPRKLYQWAEVEVVGELTLANVLVGRTQLGSQFLHDDHWSGREDAVFTHGISAIRTVASQDGQAPFGSVPPAAMEWARFFRIQMGYLLLQSAMERYLALSYGPDLEPGQKVRKLGNDPSFARHLNETVITARRVHESRGRGSAVLDPRNPNRSAKYFYVIRSNLSHRGKGAWQEAEMVRSALHDLLAIFSGMLRDAGFNQMTAEPQAEEETP